MKQLKILILGLMFTGCGDFLSVKPIKNMQIPESIDDAQALLDNTEFMNITPNALVICADEYYLEYNDWNSLLYETQKNLYIWEDEVFSEPPMEADWRNPYVIVNRSNIVLETIGGIARDPSNGAAWDNVKGAALFFRGKAFFDLAQLWAPLFDPSTANEELGIPLRLTADFNEKSVRSTNQETYDQIIKDLKEAAELLPVQTSHVMRPSRAAALGMLARVYLSMSDYESAEKHADLCLSIKDQLIDYNKLDANASWPFTLFNLEVIFNSYMSGSTHFRRAKIDSTFIESFTDNDLRKELFFSDVESGGSRFKGNYFASDIQLFNGIAVDEMYLIRAECYARSGEAQLALADLNFLAKHRYNSDGNIFAPSAPGEILQLVLEERKKQLLFRGVRWTDLKRLNKEERFQTTIKRNLNGKLYELKPNDPRYLLPIPESVIDLSGIEQNIRK